MNLVRSILCLLALFVPIVVFGQGPTTPDTTGIQYGKVYELKLKAPVKCIQQIEYDNSGKEPEWKLSEDNKTIFIENYIINTKVKLKVVYETGIEEEYTQSPCNIKLSQSSPAL